MDVEYLNYIGKPDLVEIQPYWDMYLMHNVLAVKLIIFELEKHCSLPRFPSDLVSIRL